jgi:hypothetical protein
MSHETTLPGSALHLLTLPTMCHFTSFAGASQYVQIRNLQSLDPVFEQKKAGCAKKNWIMLDEGKSSV